MPDFANFLTSEARGGASSLIAALLWSVSVSLFRAHGAERSALWLNLFKGSFAILCFGAVAVFNGSPAHIDIYAVGILALSGIVGILIGDCAFFMALPKIGSALTSSIQCLSPPLTGLFAMWFLGETLSINQVLGLTVTSACLSLLLLYESKSRREQRENSGKTPRMDGLDIRKIGRVFTGRSPANSIYLAGIMFAVVAAVCQAVGVVIARPVIDGFSPFWSGLLRLWAPVLLLSCWQFAKTKPKIDDLRVIMLSRSSFFLFLASVLGTFLGLTFMMDGIAHSRLGVALALNSTYPIWIVIGERMLGVSKLRPLSVILVIGSVSGIWLMI